MKNIDNLNIEGLSIQLKQKDSEQTAVLKRFISIYGVFALFSLLSVFYLISKTGDTEARLFALNQFCFFITFTIIFIIFRKNYIKFKNPDYSLPVLHVLKNAKNRYKFWNQDKSILLISMFIIDIPITDRFAASFEINDILITQLVFLSVIGLAMLIGYFIWKHKFQALIINIDNVIKDIERE
jgi:hypothetical protein